MATLTTLEKAPVLDDADNHLGESYDVQSSDTAVATTAKATGQLWYVYGAGVGTTTLTATRIADGGTATLEVTVSAAPFVIKLGAPVAK